MKYSGSEINSEKRKWISIFFRQVFVNTVELGKVTLKGDEHSEAPQNLLPGTSRPWPQTSRQYISDPVFPFNSSPQVLNQAGMRLSIVARTILHALWWMLFPLPVFPPHQISHYTYHSPILQSLSQIPTRRTMTWRWFPKRSGISFLKLPF